MFNYGESFRDGSGGVYRYIGPDGGEPDYNNPNTFMTDSEWEKANKVEKTEVELAEAEKEREKKEPSVLRDVTRVMYDRGSSIPMFIKDLVEGVGGLDEITKDFPGKTPEERNTSWLNAIHESVFKAIPFNSDGAIIDPKDIIDTTTGKIKDPETVTGKVLDVATIVAGGMGVVKALPQAKSKIGEFGRYFLGEQVAEQLFTDPDANMANFIQQFAPDSTENVAVIEWLAADGEDNVLENRGKMALSSLGLAASVSTTFKAIKEGLVVSSPAFKKIEDTVKSYKTTVTKDNAELTQVMRQSIPKGENFFDKPMATWFKLKSKFFTSRGYLTKRGFEAQRASVQNQRQLVTKAEHIAGRLKRFMDEDVAGSQDKEFMKQVNRALSDPRKDDAGLHAWLQREYGFSKDVAFEVAEARALIDDLSETILDTGLAKGELKKVLTDNLGAYVRRSYRLFEDPKWQPSQEVIDDAIKTVQDIKLKEALEKKPNLGVKGRKTVEAEAKTYIDDLLVGNKPSSDYISASRVHTKSIFSKRKDLPKEIRALYGEIEDPFENIILTVSKMASVAENHKFFKRVGDLGKNKYIFTAKKRSLLDTPEKKQLFGYDIQGTNTPLDGKYTTKEMKMAIEGREEQFFKHRGKALSLLLSIKGLSQKTQTAWDIQTQARNIIGGYQFGINNGINPTFRMGDTLDILGNEIGKKGNRTFDQIYEELQGLGVINTSVRAGEYRAILSAAEDAGSDSSTFLKWASDNLDKITIRGKKPFSKDLQKLPDDIYMAADDAFKISGFAKELDILRQARPNVSEDLLRKEAADIIRNTYPNYDLVPKGIKSLRELPIGNFYSFPSEIIRTSTHVIKQASKEIASGNSVIARRGVDRLTGFIATQGMWGGIGAASATMAGLTSDEYEAMNTLAETPYSNQHNKLILKAEDNIHMLDLAFLTPYNLYQELASDLYHPIVTGELYGRELDDSLRQAAFNVTGELLEPYTNPTILSRSILDVWHAFNDSDGRTPEGKRIFYNPENKSLDDLGIASAHIAAALIPGALQDGVKLAQTVAGSPSTINAQTGEARPIELELLANLTGLRFRKADFDDMLRKHASDAYWDQRALGRVPINHRTMPQEFADNYHKRQKSIIGIHQNLYRQVKAYQNLVDIGTGTNKPYVIMQKGGFPQSVSERIFSGRYNAEGISDTRQHELWLKSPATREEKKEGLKEIRKLQKKYNFYRLFPDEDPERDRKDKGGLVEDVPQVPKEPDERIDKLTGRPYNEQAGTAFIDEEDPVRRLGFLGGGLAENPLRRLGFGKGSKVTRVGRPIHEKDGERYSEKTITFQVKDKWLTFPSIDNKGNEIPQSKVEDYVKEKGPVDPLTGEKFPYHDTREEAEKWAQERSDSLVREEKYGGGKVYKALRKRKSHGGRVLTALKRRA